MSYFAPKELRLVDKQIARDVILEKFTNSSLLREVRERNISIERIAAGSFDARLHATRETIR
jgi:hypothetical protein